MKKYILIILTIFSVYGLATAPNRDVSQLSRGRVFLNNGNYFDGVIQINPDGAINVRLFSGKLSFSADEVEKIIYNCGLNIRWAIIYEMEQMVRKELSLSKRNRYRYSDIIKRVSRRYGVSEKLVNAVIRQESNFFYRAVSPKGAMGLMQLMPQTAESLGVRDVFDPVENIEGGVKYLAYLLNKFEGDKSLALAAYNAGHGAVARFGGIPPFPETINYVKRILADYND